VRHAFRLRDAVSFLAFGAIIVFVLGYFAMQGVRIKPPSGRTDLSIEVPDINGLATGSNVLLRGVPVGKVTGIATSMRASTVDFYIEGQYGVPADSEVRLENLSALGESYISLRPLGDSGRMLRSGERIETQRVTPQPSVSELATSVTRVLHQMDPHALKRVVTEADTALPDPTTTLPNMARASVLLNNTVNEMHGSGRRDLRNLQALLRDAEWVNPALNSVGPSILALGKATQDLMKQLPTLMHRGEPENLTNLNRLIARVQGLLDDRGGDLKVLGEAFQPKLNAIAASLMNFDTSQVLDNYLQQVPADGTITLHVRP
jgi:phospholipid/cholesterol/gamma-HCH transport system substrate-binding protein